MTTKKHEDDPKGDPILSTGPSISREEVGEYPGVTYDADNDVLASGKTTDIETRKENTDINTPDNNSGVSEGMLRAAALESANRLPYSNTVDLLQSANLICDWLRTGTLPPTPDVATATESPSTAI